MRFFLLSIFLVVMAMIGFACGDAGTGTNNSASNAANTTADVFKAGETPTESYKLLYAAVKSKNTEAIRQLMSSTSQTFAQGLSQQQNKPIEKVYENGFTATTFAETLPEIRDERIEGNMGAIEVRNVKENKWEDLPFVKEEGGWKLAVGDIFKGSFKSPGKGRDVKEQEAANAAGKGPQGKGVGNSNTNMMPATNMNTATNTAKPM